MKVLITGGAGFIGSHLAERLLSKGDRVAVIDNFETGRRDNLKPHANLKLVEGTICDSVLMAQLFDEFKPDVVVHAAASYKDPANYIGDAATNTHGTAVVVENAKRLQVQRLIYLQTALCYGDPQEQPITLNHPLCPGKSSYAISKTAGEHYIALSGLNFCSFRLANAYGPRNLSGPLPTFYKRLSEGKACFVTDTRRDFIYVQDMVDVLEAAVAGKGEGGFYHISSGGDYSIKALFEATLDALMLKLDGDVEVRPRGADDVESILLDPTKTQAQFNWTTKTELTDGVRQTIEYYKQYGIEQTFTHLKIEEEPPVARA